MELLYKSTRGNAERVTASAAILKGLAEDGGLYVPERIPKLDHSMREFSEMSYQETACEVMKLYLTDYTAGELRDCVEKAYDDKFDTELIAPLRDAGGAVSREDHRF